MSRSKASRHQSATDTLIGKGTEIEGTLACEANLRIEGKFNGVIESKGSVIVGEHAVARSHIHAKEVIIAGKVYGDVTTLGRLTITATGQMFGDVLGATSLVITEGGILHGSSKMELKDAPEEMAQETSSTPRYLESEAG
ncbi:bactofilin family protein [Paenibacillus cineris]|uniref:bactofilin family protein n=1 Tax=Paenibacillus cineris TaxID=237530 RepID=UPI001B0EBBC0|nr:polymer-forming cytoskeletal protein [Paenibacillus cineris]GIO63418.1 hypothetical protein J43TS9_49920 [Paenibacillus cineris]